MKYLACLLIFFTLACKKEPVKEPSTPYVPESSYNYRLAGLNTVDTAELYLNGKYMDPVHGQNIHAKPGDTIILKYAGNYWKPKGFDFAIWYAGNKAPEETIQYAYSKKRTWIREIYYINQHTSNDSTIQNGKAPKDSVIYYAWRYYISDTIILKAH